MDNVYDLWKFTEKEQAELLGADIGTSFPMIIVELDEWSKGWFYNRTYAPLTMKQYKCPMSGREIYQIILHSVDDASVNMVWEVSKMRLYPYEVKDKLIEWLKRSNYFVNLNGLKAFCTLFGKYEDNSD